MITAIIDAHAHIFPDKIALKAVKAIGDYYNIPMVASGTVSELLHRGENIGVRKYIVHSTATTVTQVPVINNFIAKETALHSEFIGFGTLHPDQGEEGINKELTRIRELNLKGIKLHPEFQGFSITDDAMRPLYRAIEGKFPVLIHMGDENANSSRPDDLVRILDEFPRLTIIAAHLGGYRMWDIAENHLLGKKVFFDTSSSLFALNPAEATRIIRAHGVDLVLFGTDYPMWDHTEELERFMKLDLTDEEREKILWKNAAKLLDITL
jgi:predicted TIM-barrel fold metal-dependent hydrolase